MRLNTVDIYCHYQIVILRRHLGRNQHCLVLLLASACHLLLLMLVLLALCISEVAVINLLITAVHCDWFSPDIGKI